MQPGCTVQLQSHGTGRARGAESLPMSATQRLVAAAMQREGLTTAYQLAKRLGYSHQRVYPWLDGSKQADEDAALALSEIAG